MSSQPKRTFKVGNKVEMCCNDEGYLGSYWEATIIETLPRGLCLIEYNNFVEEEDESKPLTDTVSFKTLRPTPPRIAPSRLSSSLEGERVDAYLKDVWWVGTVAKKVDSDRYVVYFENTGEEIVCELKKLRLHMEWVDGEWRSVKKRRATVDVEQPRRGRVWPTKEETNESSTYNILLRGVFN